MAATDTFLAKALARDPARPLLTYYDDATGERAELSAATLANWVAKTANLLQEELALAPGDRVAVLLPAHWQTAAILLATWAAGGITGTDPEDAAVAFTDLPHLPQVLAAGPGDVAALSLAPLGGGLDEPVDGVIDFATAVRVQADRFTPHLPAPDDVPAVDTADGVLTAADLVAQAQERAAEMGLHEADRVLSVLEWQDPADWMDGLLSPLAAGASLVLCANPDPAELIHRAEAEHVTASLGVALAGIRAL
jgi:uncharacterized protein (TIGR03089 family)